MANVANDGRNEAGSMANGGPDEAGDVTDEGRQSIFQSVVLHTPLNNAEHRTSEISVDRLIVRRGQPFKLTINLSRPFIPALGPLCITATTGEEASEEQGTLSLFSIPEDATNRSASAKAVWKAEPHWSATPLTGHMSLTITPPADTPIGQYTLRAKYSHEETVLAVLVVLFNTWCSDDWVFLPHEAERKEYVMTEQGVIYIGSGDYISSLHWNFGQFEADLIDVCLKILDINPKHLNNPAEDNSARCNPIYVGRLVSAMINSNDDSGVLKGSWASTFPFGVPPTHWSGSVEILRRWYQGHCQPVRYGQCWVFAGVMCTVMRLLGIPCRVVTNYESAHDTNGNLSIDVYHADYGVMERESPDSIWNFHVWVEGWMRRPDLTEDNKYDGWQVFDPTPQERSNGVYCCGPASVTAILNGDVDLKYDLKFVFAEVNADCIDWLIFANGLKKKIFSDTGKIGQNISTKSVGSNKRWNITDNYKHREGSKKERSIFKYATTRKLLKSGNKKMGLDEENGADPDGSDDVHPPQELSMQFEEVSKPRNGQDVSLKLLVNSKDRVTRTLSFNISVQAMTYNGSSAANIQSEVKDETLQPGKVLFIPVLVPFTVYGAQMMHWNSMKVSALVTDKEKPDFTYLAEDNVVLQNPPISITVIGLVRLHRPFAMEVIFMNPINDTLKDCSLTLSGSGIFRKDEEFKLPDVKPSHRLRANVTMYPYKTGERTLHVDFNCSVFKDIKGICTINIKL
ncbi:protein-glutamine gamma-glutamyltransferase 2 [Genypterus blacodes]|uniref:protein-glutamine gamma-glutamyltransferase 2 n=1 Tax=Genypterus blacodes TaxID=154954 RepID=UPI003F775EB7